MDIGFSVQYKKAPDGSEKTIVPWSRVNCHMVPEDGVHLCSEPGICRFLLLLFFVFLHNCYIISPSIKFLSCMYSFAFRQCPQRRYVFRLYPVSRLFVRLVRYCFVTTISREWLEQF